MENNIDIDTAQKADSSDSAADADSIQGIGMMRWGEPFGAPPSQATEVTGAPTATPLSNKEGL
jgi:hypothetical protein